MPRPSSRENNFDVLRLVAAGQVAFFHCANHLHVALDPSNPIVAFAMALPGVPIFFVLSGFLISLSLERNPALSQYARNRLLRIYPALWLCLLVSIASAAVIGRIDFFQTRSLLWLLAQATIVQFYNPDFLLGYGVGVLNGSLWTIPVELQFYTLLPIIYSLFRLRTRPGNLLLLAVAIVSLAVWSVLGEHASSSWLAKLMKVSVVPYLWMFLIGVLMQRNFERLGPLLVNRGHWWLIGYALIVATGPLIGIRVSSNVPHPIAMCFLAFTAIACAYTAPTLSRRMLRGNDISYGVYIYHAVLLNAALEVGARKSIETVLLLAVASAAAGWASWSIIERPALRLKRDPLRSIQNSQTSGD